MSYAEFARCDDLASVEWFRLSGIGCRNKDYFFSIGKVKDAPNHPMVVTSGSNDRTRRK